MIIPFALFKKDGDVEQRVRPFDITSYEEYREKYRNHLFCSEEGCTAQIEWAHRMDHRYFRTWRHSKHAPGCIYAFENDPTRVITQAADTVLTLVTGEHKKRSLRSANRMQKEDDGLVPRTPRTRSRPNPNRPRTETGGVRLVASFDPDAQPAETGAKAPRIYNRKCENVTPTDHGKILNVRGRISRAVIRDQSVRFFFNTNGGPVVSALFYNRFRDNSPQSYSWIEEIGRRINAGAITDLQMCCISVCEWKDSECTIQVFDAESITIEGMSLTAYVRDMTST